MRADSNREERGDKLRRREREEMTVWEQERGGKMTGNSVTTLSSCLIAHSLTDIHSLTHLLLVNEGTRVNK